MKAIRVESYGGPEMLRYQDIDRPEPKRGEALVRIEAIGVNFIDVYHRTGLYPLPLPFTPGSEAAGTVEAVGADVTDIAVGDRVAYAMGPGSYAEYATPPASRLVKMPEGIDARAAAAAMLQGMTAHYLVNSTYQLKQGDTCCRRRRGPAAHTDG
jgi:NADPH2:quinone reductase